MTLPAIAASLLFLLQAPKGSIEGTDVSSTTNQPVAGAQVTANRSQVSPDLAAQMSAGLIGGFAGRPAPPPANQMATTDRDGRFILHDIDPGTYVLSASADRLLPPAADRFGEVWQKGHSACRYGQAG